METFNLNWNQFPGNIMTNLKSFKDGQEFADVTLVCDEDKQVKAHKVILSSCSDLFRNILLNNPHQHPLVYLAGVSFHNLQSLVNFAYLGETEVNQENLESFLTVARTFKIKGLIGENIEQPLPNNLSEQCKKSTTEFSTVKNEETGAQDVMNVGSELNGLLEDLLEEREDAYKISNDETIRYEKNKDKLSCSKCGNMFSLQHSLRRHIRYAHEGVRYPCIDCSYKATTLSHLKRHQINSHDQ